MFCFTTVTFAQIQIDTFLVEILSKNGDGDAESNISDNADKQFPCTWPGCGKRFTRKSYVKEHVAKQHEGEGYVCNVEGCNSSFQRRSNLEIHLKAHLGQFEFVCDICKQGFTSKSNLSTHLKMHDPERAFECHCLKRYKTEKMLKQHASKCPRVPVVCPMCNGGFKREDITEHCKLCSQGKVEVKVEVENAAEQIGGDGSRKTSLRSSKNWDVGPSRTATQFVSELSRWRQ